MLLGPSTSSCLPLYRPYRTLRGSVIAKPKSAPTVFLFSFTYGYGRVCFLRATFFTGSHAAGASHFSFVSIFFIGTVFFSCCSFVSFPFLSPLLWSACLVLSCLVVCYFCSVSISFFFLYEVSSSAYFWYVCPVTSGVS